MTQFTCKGVKQINNRISLNMTFTFTIRISRRFSSAREFQMGNFQKYWSQIVGQDFIVLDFFHGRKILKVDRKGPQNDVIHDTWVCTENNRHKPIKYMFVECVSFLSYVDTPILMLFGTYDRPISNEYANCWYDATSVYCLTSLSSRPVRVAQSLGFLCSVVDHCCFL